MLAGLAAGDVGCHVAVGGVARVTVREFPRDACHGVALGSLWSAGIWVGSVDQKPHVKCKTVYSHVAVRTSHSGVAQSYGFWWVHSYPPIQRLRGFECLSLKKNLLKFPRVGWKNMAEAKGDDTK